MEPIENIRYRSSPANLLRAHRHGTGTEWRTFTHRDEGLGAYMGGGGTVVRARLLLLVGSNDERPQAHLNMGDATANGVEGFKLRYEGGRKVFF